SRPWPRAGGGKLRRSVDSGRRGSSHCTGAPSATTARRDISRNRLTREDMQVTDVRISPATDPFDAYDRRDVPEPDHELTRVGPGTPCGEYFRRFWQPVRLSSDLKDLPVRVRVLAEDLVLFRDGQGRTGLLPLHCSHRGTSLEFGMVERVGIRCCYHGWLYDVAG